jgi:hypothetical protein|tara:strand:- start:239 stop:457 length:219 start_codon:yes stop_codon:yes gene_type:complete
MATNKNIKIKYSELHKFLIDYVEVNAEDIKENCEQFTTYNSDNIAGMAYGFELLINRLHNDFKEQNIKFNFY